MSRFYTANPTAAVNIPATNAFDFFEIIPADDKSVQLHWVKIGQTGTADFGDAQEEGVPIGIYRVPATVTSGSGGSTPTARLVAATGTAASFAVEASNTTVATTSGTLELLEVFCWNVRVPETQILIPEFRYEFVQGSALVVRAIVGPNDALATAYYSIGVEEFG